MAYTENEQNHRDSLEKTLYKGKSTPIIITVTNMSIG
jgi:hypothetical protein